ncbi:MAG: hypothetical protein MHPSP_001957, partial [Paramarteilia canceri]
MKAWLAELIDSFNRNSDWSSDCKNDERYMIENFYNFLSNTEDISILHKVYFEFFGYLDREIKIDSANSKTYECSDVQKILNRINQSNRGLYTSRGYVFVINYVLDNQKEPLGIICNNSPQTVIERLGEITSPNS